MTEQLGSYELDRARRTLRQVATGQSIRCESEDGNQQRFVYCDAEVTIQFEVEFLRGRPWNGWTGTFAFVDFNQPALANARRCYGLWRRLTFFLLDGLVVWFFATTGEHERFSHVELIGGWQNGTWSAGARLQAGLNNPNGADPHKGSVASFTPFPLDEPALTWR